MGHLPVVLQIGPGTGKPHHDAAGADDDLGSHLDQASAPSARLPFSQRVSLTTVVEVVVAILAGQSLCRQFRGALRAEADQQLRRAAAREDWPPAVCK